MRNSRLKIEHTVALMSAEWSNIVRTTGQLTEADMDRTLQAARKADKQVAMPGGESTYVLMQHLLMGEEEFKHI
jgi:hypothetical protein